MGLCTLSWGYISCLIFRLIPQLQSLSTLPYHTFFYFLFLVLFSYCCSTLYLPLSVSHLSPSPLVYCLSLCVSRLKQYLSSLWVETLLSSFVLLFCEGLHSHSQPCVLTSAPKGCNVKLDLTSGWHYICMSNSGFGVLYTQTLTDTESGR